MLAFTAVACLLATGLRSEEVQVHGPVQFTNVAEAAGLLFVHENGATPEKYLPETMGSGAVILDYDSDGWPDILLIDGGSFVDPVAARNAQPRLYRNNHDGTFSDQSTAIGIGLPGYGMGACSADYDNDGRVDLYITSVGKNKLFRNLGTGRFEDVTGAAGVGFEQWSSSCAFGDVDNDGDVDLYVANYVDFTVEENKYCGDDQGHRHYCHPNLYRAVPDLLYRNNGDGTFEDAADELGLSEVAGFGLGVVFTDYDNDGWPDIYVANDSTFNFLFHNKDGKGFEESALLSGVAVGGDGNPQAGMGTDAADIDGDGAIDMFVSNLDRETHSLYRNLGHGLFADITFQSGVGPATLPFVGFGAVFFDYDNDSDLDIAIANGGIFDNASRFRDSISYEQRNLLLRNDGKGAFDDAGPTAGSGFAARKVSRALAAGDLDNDGDLDLVISNNGQSVDLLRNEGGNHNNALLVRLVGTESNRDGIGSRLRLKIGNRSLLRTIKAGSSYLAQNDLRVHFGMAKAERADLLEIRWPSGVVDVIAAVDLEANRILTVMEGKGIVERQLFQMARK